MEVESKPVTPSELTIIQEQIDEWVDRGAVKTRRLSQGAKSPKRVFYRVTHPWEIEAPPPGMKKHMHDWRHDMMRQGETSGIIYCSGCDVEVTRPHRDFADPRVIRNKSDGLGRI